MLPASRQGWAWWHYVRCSEPGEGMSRGEVQRKGMSEGGATEGEVLREGMSPGTARRGGRDFLGGHDEP
jgi:hypothetical protein